MREESREEEEEIEEKQKTPKDQGSPRRGLPVSVDAKTVGIVLMPKPTDHNGARHHDSQSYGA